MAFNIYALFNDPMTRFFARIARHCTIILSTGKEVTFDKSRDCGCASYSSPLTKAEEQEYIHAMMLMGI